MINHALPSKHCLLCETMIFFVMCLQCQVPTTPCQSDHIGSVHTWHPWQFCWLNTSNVLSGHQFSALFKILFAYNSSTFLWQLLQCVTCDGVFRFILGSCTTNTLFHFSILALWRYSSFQLLTSHYTLVAPPLTTVLDGLTIAKYDM